MRIAGATSAGNYSGNVTLTSTGANTNTVAVSGTVIEAGAVPVVTGTNFSGRVGVLFSNTLVASNSPTNFSIASGTLPGGLTFNSNSGTITGTPTNAGSNSITVTAANANGTSSNAATIGFTIAKGTNIITFGSLPRKRVGDAAFALVASNSAGLPVSFTSSNPAVATVSGSDATLAGAGTAVIIASQGGNQDYDPANDALQTLWVDSANTVYWNFDTATPTYGVPGNVTIGSVGQGNNNGTTALLGTTSASSGYAGVSGSTNAGASAFTGALSSSSSTYFSFSITPSSGYSAILRGLSFGSRSTGTGPLAYSLRSSQDNYASDLLTGALSNNSSWIFLQHTNVAITNTSPTTYRLYGHSGTGSAAANTANWRIDDLAVVMDSSINANPTLNFSTNAITGLSSFQGFAGTPGSYTVTGLNLDTNPVVISASTNSLEISTNSTTGYGPSLELSPTAGAVSNTVFVRLSSAAPLGAVSGALSHVSGSLSNNVSVSGTVNPLGLGLSLSAATIAEDSAGTVTGTVTIPAVNESNLVVALASTNTSAATVPASVTITSGQTNATFAITPVRQASNYRDQTTRITASATGYAGASNSLTVLNVDLNEITLSSSARYRQNFSSLSGGLPQGWSTWTGASASSLGTELDFTNGSSTAWNDSAARFKNFAAMEGTNTTDPGATATNRALGVKQTGSFGDPGAAFTLAVANTLGRANLTLSFKAMTLSADARSTTWSVQAATNASPTNFITLAEITDRGAISTTNIVITNLTAIENLNTKVWIRIAALSASTGTGSRDSFAIDDVSFGVKIDPAVISSVTPDSATGGGLQNVNLTLSGSGFRADSVVKAGTNQLATTFNSSSSLTAVLPANLLVNGQVWPITVEHEEVPSAAVNFTVNHPAPTLSSLSPASAAAGSAGATVFLQGSGYSTNTTVSWGGNPIVPTYHGPGMLSVQASAAQLASAGAVTVSVSNPTPGGGSAGQTFTVTPAGTPSLFTDPAVLPSVFSGSPGSVTESDFYQYFLVNGSNLAGDVTLTAPPSFEISVDFWATWGSSATISLTELNAGAVEVAVRYKPTAPGKDTGLIVISQGNISTAVLVAGTSERSLQLSATALSWARTTAGQWSIYNPTLSVTGVNLSGNVTLTTSGDSYALSVNGINKTNSITLTPSSGALTRSLFVHFKPTSTNSSITGLVQASYTDGDGTLAANVNLTGQGNIPLNPNLTVVGGNQQATVALGVPTTTTPNSTVYGDTFVLLAQIGATNSNAPVASAVAGYTANAAYGQGTEVGNSFVVFRGSGLVATNFVMTGLSNRTEYTVRGFTVSDGQFLSSGTHRTVMAATPLTNVIAQWHFNSLTSTIQGTHNLVSADQGPANAVAYTTNGVTGARIAGSDWDSSTNNYGWTTTSYSTTSGPNLSAVVFAVSTVGKKDIEIEYDTSASSSGAKFTVVEISTNGATWTPVLTNELGSTDNTWQEKRYIDLRANTNVNNQPLFQFRVRPTTNSAGVIVNLGGTNVFNSGGTTRFDRVTVAGTDGQFPPVISGPSTLSGTVGVAITPVTVTASGSPTLFAATNLPAGLTINPTTGQITGTPEVSVTNAIVVLSAENGNGLGTANLSVTIAKGTPTITAAPTASALTVGASLSSSTLTGGSASVAGTFAWTDGTIVPSATGSYGVTFTPTDTANYNTATTTVSVTLVHFLESALGDFSGAAGSPTTLNLGTSSKSLLGSVTGGTDSADYLTFTVPGGYRLDAVWLRSYQSTDNVAFMAIDEGAIWSAAQDTSAMLGYSHFGGSGDVGTDLLTKMNVAGSSLAAGTYTVWIQQLGAATTYGLEFELTALPAGSTFAGWSGGAPLNAANVGKYAIGGASSLTATDGVAPTSTISGSNLVLTAIVRTDDTKLTVVGEAVTTLADYTNAPSITPVNGTTNGVSQTGVPNGHQRQAFSVPQGADTRKFLRLKATLAP